MFIVGRPYRLLLFFFIELKPGNYGHQLFFVYRGRGEEWLVEGRLYVWEGFVANNPGWPGGHPSESYRHRPIRTPRAFPLLSVRTATHQATSIRYFYYIDYNRLLFFAFFCFINLKVLVNIMFEGTGSGGELRGSCPRC